MFNTIKQVSFIQISIIIILFISSFVNAMPIGPIDYDIKTNDVYEYHSYESMISLLNSLSNNYSDISQLISLGTTYEGRNIWMMKITDNPSENEDETAVLFMGAHHGNEKPSYESLIFFITYVLETYGMDDYDNDGDGSINEDFFDGIDNDNDRLIDEDPSEQRLKNIIDSTEIYIVPMVNPDGVEYNWRKNRAPNCGSFGNNPEITSFGVDLNRNYDYYWYLPLVFPLNYMLPFIINDESWNYRGEFAFSENETRAIRNLVLSNDNIKISLSYHSYSEVIIFPWTHTSLDTPDEFLFTSIGENISKINSYHLLNHGWSGREYIIPRFSGTIGTSENWLYGERGIIAFTIELGKSRVPIDIEEVFDYCWKHVGVNLYIAERSISID